MLHPEPRKLPAPRARTPLPTASTASRPSVRSSYFFVRCAQSSAHAGLAWTEEGRLSFLTAYSWALHVVHRLRYSPYLWNLLNDVVEVQIPFYHDIKSEEAAAGVPVPARSPSLA